MVLCIYIDGLQVIISLKIDFVLARLNSTFCSIPSMSSLFAKVPD